MMRQQDAAAIAARRQNMRNAGRQVGSPYQRSATAKVAIRYKQEKRDTIMMLIGGLIVATFIGLLSGVMAPRG